MSEDARNAQAGDLGPDAWTRALGIEMLETTPARVVARLHADSRHHQPYGILHGGVYCSIVETVASHGAGQAARAWHRTRLCRPGWSGRRRNDEWVRAPAQDQAMPTRVEWCARNDE